MQMRVVQVLGLGLGPAEEPQEVAAATGDRNQKKVRDWHTLLDSDCLVVWYIFYLDSDCLVVWLIFCLIQIVWLFDWYSILIQIVWLFDWYSILIQIVWLFDWYSILIQIVWLFDWYSILIQIVWLFDWYSAWFRLSGCLIDILLDSDCLVVWLIFYLDSDCLVVWLIFYLDSDCLVVWLIFCLIQIVWLFDWYSILIQIVWLFDWYSAWFRLSGCLIDILHASQSWWSYQGKTSEWKMDTALFFYFFINCIWCLSYKIKFGVSEEGPSDVILVSSNDVGRIIGKQASFFFPCLVDFDGDLMDSLTCKKIPLMPYIRKLD